MDATPDRLQRITLLVQGLSMPLTVPPDDEPQYREASVDLNKLVDIYRNRYPDVQNLPAYAYMTMAALDRAYHTVLLRREIEMSTPDRTIQELNVRIEDFLASMA